MEKIFFDFISGESLSSVIVFLLQLITVLTIVLYLKNIAERVISWQKFKRLLMAGLGSKISIEGADGRITGKVTYLTASREACDQTKLT